MTFQKLCGKLGYTREVTVFVQQPNGGGRATGTAKADSTGPLPPQEASWSHHQLLVLIGVAALTWLSALWVGATIRAEQLTRAEDRILALEQQLADLSAYELPVGRASAPLATEEL